MAATSNQQPNWENLGDWWLDELGSDPAYEDEVAPMLLELARPAGRVLDVGCGEGRLMERLSELGCQAYGVDIAANLLKRAGARGHAVRARLPDLSCFGDEVFDGALVSLVLEHIEDHERLFGELARVVSSGGFLAMLLNHPIYTAPESAPIEEPDGEVLWRTGRYLDIGFTDEPAGGATVRFHHRPMGDLLTRASEAGWDLHRMIETGVTESQVRRHPPLGAQRHLPRLLGARWVRR